MRRVFFEDPHFRCHRLGLEEASKLVWTDYTTHACDIFISAPQVSRTIWNFNSKELISTTYHPLNDVLYCTRPEDVKRLGAIAVSTICHWEHVACAYIIPLHIRMYNYMLFLQWQLCCCHMWRKPLADKRLMKQGCFLIPICLLGILLNWHKPPCSIKLQVRWWYSYLITTFWMSRRWSKTFCKHVWL